MTECENEEHQKFSFKDGLSINETKTSALIICTFVDFGLIVWGVVAKGDFSDNLLFLSQTLIAAIAGVNIADKLTAFKKGVK